MSRDPVDNVPPPVGEPGTTAAFSVPLYRWMWLAGLSTNLGLLTLGVGAAWAMTQMSRSPADVALVQTATWLPMMLLAIPAGAVADMFDRRVVVLVGMAISFTAASVLSLLAYAGLLTPLLLLSFISLMGCSMALTGPSAQAAVSEQVPPRLLPSAIALTSVSYNLARSVGPAVGGAIVAAFGSLAAFAFSAFAYVPAFITYLRWRRRPAPPRLPPERLARAIVSGVKFIGLSPPVRTVLIRMIATGIAYGALVALMPLISRDLIGGAATTFGILLGGLGAGAVGGALLIGHIRRLLPGEPSLQLCTFGAGLAVMAISRVSSLWAALPLLVVAGACWTVFASQSNIVVQLSAPRWVTGRCLAAFSAAGAGGMALGAFLWGVVAQHVDLRTTLLMSGLATIASAALALRFRTPTVRDNRDVQEAALLPDPDVELAITNRSGPIVIEIEYRVASEHARPFYRAILSIQAARQRNGAYGWSIARDVADPDLWVERYHCPSWLDYLHQRTRTTQAEQEMHDQLQQFHGGGDAAHVRRLLERPFGSVRWSDESPDVPHALAVLTP